jgi:hypothetical protein
MCSKEYKYRRDFRSLIDQTVWVFVSFTSCLVSNRQWSSWLFKIVLSRKKVAWGSSIVSSVL